MIQRHSILHVGDHVKLDFGSRRVIGKIVEERGPIGASGRNLFRVEIPMDPFDSLALELPEDELEVVSTREIETSVLTSSEIIDYLANGGLISLLRLTAADKRNQQRVWLWRNQAGQVAYTLDPEQGKLGGQPVPALAVDGDKIPAPKKAEVKSFLMRFGLAEQDADRVVTAVGTTPK